MFHVIAVPEIVNQGTISVSVVFNVFFLFILIYLRN